MSENEEQEKARPLSHRRVAIVGSGYGLGLAVTKALLSQSVHVVSPKEADLIIMTESLERKNIIDINGTYYKEKPVSGRNNDRLAKWLIPAIEAYTNTYTRKRPQVNIVSEFELIQQKKSKLCKSDRDWVVRQFNSMFVTVNNQS